MSEIVVTVVGRDRPGIVADVSSSLAELGLNLTDSSMTLLRGHFAMTLVCSGPASVDDGRAALAWLASESERDGLLVTVRELSDLTTLGAGAPEVTGDRPYTLVVHGADRLGIVAEVTRVLSRAGGNITDLTTRLAGTLYLLSAEVELPGSADVGALSAQLATVAAGLGVEVSLRPSEADVL